MKKWTVAVTLILFSLFFNFNAKAEVFKDGQIVAKDKIWTITFNRPVQIDANTEQSITVCDSDGNNVSVSLRMGQDDRSIVINPPSAGYESGAVYYLTVDEKMKSQDSKELDNPMTMSFSIQNDNSNSTGSAIEFKDKNLEKAVRNSIGKPTGDLTKSDLEKVNTLAAVGQNISDISGIENLTNLNSLYLGGNPISNLQPLEKLSNLETLNLVGCQISDITSISKLSNLQFLFLSDNNIQNITDISKLTKLQYLSLDNNKINDVSPLLYLSNLTDLEISNNQITDSSPLIKLDSQLKRKDYEVNSGTVVWNN